MVGVGGDVGFWVFFLSAFFWQWAGGCRVAVVGVGVGVAVMSAGKRVGWAAYGAAVFFPSTRLGEAFRGTSYGTLDWKRLWYSRENAIFIFSLFLSCGCAGQWLLSSWSQ